jgi:hypothetical protein
MAAKKHIGLLYLIIKNIILFMGKRDILFFYLSLRGFISIFLLLCFGKLYSYSYLYLYLLLGGFISVILNGFLSQIYYFIVYSNLL